MLAKLPKHINTYEIEIPPHLRIRNHIESVGGKTTHFAITLELEVAPNDWRAVVRFDTTGGEVHRDRLKPDGSYLTHRESVRMGFDLDDAIRNIRQELFSNFTWYVNEFKQLMAAMDYD